MSADDNNSDLEEQKIDRQRRRLGMPTDMDPPPDVERGGGYIGGDSRDSLDSRRLSALIRWGATLIGAVILGIAGWTANRIADNLSSLNDTATKLVVQNTVIIARLDKSDSRDDTQDTRLNQNEREIAAIEGRVFRGVSGYEVRPKSGH